MRTVHLRLHSLIFACSLLLGAAACSPADDNDNKPILSSLRDTASPESSAEQAAVRTENLDEIDLSQPLPDDLTFDDDKNEKNSDCCVFKNSGEQVCRCETVTGRPAGTYFECLVKGASTKRGSGCGAYQDCNDAVAFRVRCDW